MALESADQVVAQNLQRRSKEVAIEANEQPFQSGSLDAQHLQLPSN